MRKFLSLVFLMFVLFGCKDENEQAINVSPEGLNIDKEFVHLSDNNSSAAGHLTIQADVPEVSIQWISNEAFNLDTTQTIVKLSGGKGILPIKWEKRVADSKYAPIDMLFKAWVKITAGDQKKLVPLIWAEKLDSTKVMEGLIQTRAVDTEDPLASFIQFVPDVLPLNAERGGSMFVILQNIQVAIMNYAGFKPAYNMDLSTLPDTIQSSRLLNFKWTAAGAPNLSFDAELFVYTLEAGQFSYHVTYDGGSVAPPVEELQFQSSNLPTGNIPVAGGTYTFTFAGTYTGGLQVKAIIDGIAQAPGNIAANKQPKCTVGANTGNATRNIQFEYKTDASDWIALPATNRIQDKNGSGGSGVTPGTIIPTGDVPDQGNAYYCDFKGAYTGAIIFRATSDGVEVVRKEGTAPGLLIMTVPGITGKTSATIRFEYSIDGGNTWTLIETKNQTQETLAVNAIEPVGNIPVAGGVYKCSISGTYSKNVNLHAISNGKVLATTTGRPPATLSLTIPANTGASRVVTFEYSLSNGGWKMMEIKRQNGQ